MRWLAFVLLAGAAQAQEVYLTDGGTTWALDLIEGGAVLQNADDPADEIVITTDCTASHPVHGEGTWVWDSSGLDVIFAETVVRLDGNIPLDAPQCGA